MKCKIAKNAHFYGKRNIHLVKPLVIGPCACLDARHKVESVQLEKEGIWVDQYTKIHPYAQIFSNGGYIQVGKHCTIQSFSILYGTGGLVIGDYVMIAPGCYLLAEKHKFFRTDVPIKHQGLSFRGIKIADDVLIGANSVILDGVAIGKGSIIVPGSVIMKSVLPYTVVSCLPEKTFMKRV